MATNHDALKDRIAGDYFYLPPLTCNFCKNTQRLPTRQVDRVTTEHSYHPETEGQHRLRADVTALDCRGNIIAVVEVIDSSSPSDVALAAQRNLPAVFYVELGALDDDFRGYCSPMCWENRKFQNVIPWSVPICEECARPLHELKFPQVLTDWENPYEPACLECAAERTGAQWRSLGDPSGRIPGDRADVVDLFLAFSDADFWAKVWTIRTGNPSGAWKDESATATRLSQVEAAFDVGDWYLGNALLQPIGAPAWDQPDTGPRLYAWDPKNCERTSVAWGRLREHRLSALPATLQQAVRRRNQLSAHQLERQSLPESSYTPQLSDGCGHHLHVASPDGYPPTAYHHHGVTHNLEEALALKRKILVGGGIPDGFENVVWVNPCENEQCSIAGQL